MFAVLELAARCLKRSAWPLVHAWPTPLVWATPLIPTTISPPFEALLLTCFLVGGRELLVGDNKHIVMVKLYWSCFISHKIVNCISILIYVCIYNFKCTLHKVDYGIIFFMGWELPICNLYLQIPYFYILFVVFILKCRYLYSCFLMSVSILFSNVLIHSIIKKKTIT